jgi:hypothetical protein
MALATIDQITNDISQVLPIYDTELYEDQVKMLVQGAMSKLESEGVPNVFEYQTFKYYDYITCLRYQVACDMDLDIDIDRLKAQYITRVNTLRCSLNLV